MSSDESRIFKLPICYTDTISTLSSTIKEDMEISENNRTFSDMCTTILNPTSDVSLVTVYNDENKQMNSLYNNMFNPTNPLEEYMVNEWSTYFTSNHLFLKDSQKLYKLNVVNKDKYKHGVTYDNQKEILNSIISITGENVHYESMHFFDWSCLRFLNSHSIFLQCISLWTIGSPVYTLCLPIFLMIVPFFMLRYLGQSLTITSYFTKLLSIIQNTVIGQFGSLFRTIPWDKRIYICISLVMYGVQIYQNIQTMFRFRRSIINIFHKNSLLCTFIGECESNFSLFERMTRKMDSYKNFNHDILSSLEILKKYRKTIEEYTNRTFDANIFFSFGTILKEYYVLCNSIELQNAIVYMIHFSIYLKNISSISSGIETKQLNKITIKRNTRTKFVDGVYPIIKEGVSNDISLSNNMIITGPNASGKTTLLKSTLYNILISQQLGLAYCKTGKIDPYDKLHCYLNIPDTSGRDSLFQSEARRCKEILDDVMADETKRHFCIFDELYSGTNPYEATASSFSFVKYLAAKPNIDFMLTTHFQDLCPYFKKINGIRNYSLHTEYKDNGRDLIYTYCLEEKPSLVKGGVSVLRQLEYPLEILIDTETFLNKMIA